MKKFDDKQLKWLKWIVFDNMTWLDKHVSPTLEKHTGKSGMLVIKDAVMKGEYSDATAPALNLVRDLFIEDELILNKWRAKLEFERKYPLSAQLL